MEPLPHLRTSHYQGATTEERPCKFIGFSVTYSIRAADSDFGMSSASA